MKDDISEIRMKECSFIPRINSAQISPDKFAIRNPKDFY